MRACVYVCVCVWVCVCGYHSKNGFLASSITVVWSDGIGLKVESDNLEQSVYEGKVEKTRTSVVDSLFSL